MIKVSFLARAAIGLAVILAGLGWMTLSHETARSSGRDVIFQTNPVDPRDVFFGHYAILNYRDFGDRDVSVPWRDPRGFQNGETVYVALTPSEQFETPGAVFATLEEATATGVPVLKAELVEAYAPIGEDPEVFWLRFDLPEQYFADPETAIALQTDFETANAMQGRRDRWETCRDLQQTAPDQFEQSWMCEDFDLADEPRADIPEYGVILSVSDQGEAVIKGLYLDGRRLYDSLTGPRLTLDNDP
ncbi:GDYXXLXY domain-containing protein [Oceanicaulis sp.]|uniref:GDYXXLXY domain-containing protein n=1 Tax=Oceanicaulis sp. TaxID=1924941 RepID=UPI003BAD377F